MNCRKYPFRLASQAGYTAVEMIITMALTGILSGAIFSSFLVLDRIQTAWQERDQARAVGVLAEQPLLRDVQAYKVVQVGPPLVLSGISTDGAPVKVSYAVVTSRTGEPELQRSVRPCLSGCTGAVAHGVKRVTVTCTNGSPGGSPILTVNMWLDAISAKPPAQSVQVSPPLTLAARNLQVCP